MYYWTLIYINALVAHINEIIYIRLFYLILINVITFNIFVILQEIINNIG